MEDKELASPETIKIEEYEEEEGPNPTQIEKKFYVPKQILEINNKMPTMMIYKALKSSKNSLEKLVLMDCKEDLVHMFNEVGLNKLKILEINVYNEVKQNKKKQKDDLGEIPRIPLNRLQGLVELKLMNCPTLTNHIFEIIVDNLTFLSHLEIGGRPEEYNSYITLDGIRILCGSESESNGKDDDEEDDFRMHKGLKSSLVTLKIEYCIKIGNQAIELICNRFYETLENFSIIRNYYEFSAKITDEALESFNKCKNLQKLEIVYSRNFDNDCIRLLSTYFKNLRVLNLQDCPVQESFEPLATGCPFLEELNMSGDSWVKEEALVGLCKHQNLMIYHLGHFEHADIECLETDEPEKGKFIGKLLSSPTNLPNLKMLFLEKCCLSMYIENSIKQNREDVSVYISSNYLNDVLFKDAKNLNKSGVDDWY